MTVIVYSKPACIQCTQTKNRLKSKGIDFVEKNISEDSEAANEFFSYGVRSVPLVVAGDEHWAGYKQEKIDSLV